MAPRQWDSSAEICKWFLGHCNYNCVLLLLRGDSSVTITSTLLCLGLCYHGRFYHYTKYKKEYCNQYWRFRRRRSGTITVLVVKSKPGAFVAVAAASIVVAFRRDEMLVIDEVIVLSDYAHCFAEESSIFSLLKIGVCCSMFDVAVILFVSW